MKEDDVFNLNQLQLMRSIGHYHFYNNGWWHNGTKRFCFYRDINVPTNFLVLAEWMEGEELIRDTFHIELYRPLSPFNKVNEEEMLQAFQKAEAQIRKRCVEV